MSASSDVLDAYVDAGLRLLGLTIQPEWRADVREQLAIVLRNAELVAGFPLPDDLDPAPVFEVCKDER